MTEDYSELEGKEIKVNLLGNDFIGRVIGIDRDIGITIVEEGRKNHYLMCLLGPVGYKTVWGTKTKFKKKDYNEHFNEVAEMISKGEVIVDELFYMKNRIQSGAGPQVCAFGQ